MAKGGKVCVRRVVKKKNVAIVYLAKLSVYLVMNGFLVLSSSNSIPIVWFWHCKVGPSLVVSLLSFFFPSVVRKPLCNAFVPGAHKQTEPRPARTNTFTGIFAWQVLIKCFIVLQSHCSEEQTNTCLGLWSAIHPSQQKQSKTEYSPAEPGGKEQDTTCRWIVCVCVCVRTRRGDVSAVLCSRSCQ